MAYFPFMMEIEGRKLLIIGGGKVALRKCKIFLEYGAQVTVVSPRLCPELAALCPESAAFSPKPSAFTPEPAVLFRNPVPKAEEEEAVCRAEKSAEKENQKEPFAGTQDGGSLQWIDSEYREEFLDREVFAVVAATDRREVNRRIAGDCQRRRLPVNVADDPRLCSFIVPALVRRGDLSIAVSTGGKSPGLASRIRQELALRYDESYGERLALLGVYRDRVLAEDLPEEEKQKLLRESLDLPRRQLLRRLEEKKVGKGWRP